MTERVPLNLSDSVMGAVATMAEGNPGAAIALSKLVSSEDDGLMLLLHLDDMNMRGEQVYVAHKEHCAGDMAKMVNFVNGRCRGAERAVQRGASFDSLPGRKVGARGMGL